MLEPVLIAGPAARRADDHHHRRGELSGLRRRHPGPVADGADARRRRSMSAPSMISDTVVEADIRQPPVPAEARRRRHVDLRRADRRHRRAGALARPSLGGDASRASASPPAPPATASSSRARTCSSIGGGNTAVEEALYLSHLARKVTARPPARRLPRRTHHAGPPFRARQRRGPLGHGARRGARNAAASRRRSPARA